MRTPPSWLKCHELAALGYIWLCLKLGVNEHTPACVQVLGARAGEEEEGREGLALASADQVYLLETCCADYTYSDKGTYKCACIVDTLDTVNTIIMESF